MVKEDRRQSDGWIGIIGSLRFATFHTHRPNNNLGGGETKQNKPAHDTHDTHDVFFSSAHRRLISLSLPTYLPYLIT